MTRLAHLVLLLLAVVAAPAMSTGAAAQPAATSSSGSASQDPVSEFVGTWHGLVTGREMAGGGLAQRATLVVQPDGKWTLNAGGAQSEGTLKRVGGDVLELEGRFVPDGGPAGARLQRIASGDLVGSVVTRFPLTGSMTTGIRLERERSEATQAAPAQALAASRFQAGQFAGTWLGLATGREMFGSGIVQPARLVMQLDGRWTLTTGGARSEGTISQLAGDLVELQGRFVPDGGLAGGRLQRVADGRLIGTVGTRFLTGSMVVGIDLERERPDTVQALPIQPVATTSPFADPEVLQSP